MASQKPKWATKDGYVQKFALQGAVVSAKQKRTGGTPSIGRSRDNAGDQTFYDAIKQKRLQIALQPYTRSVTIVISLALSQAAGWRTAG
jgi:hypothetical protein